MVTIAEGDEGEQGYRQVTFAAQTDDPFKTVYFRSGEGTYQDLMNLINRAKDRFWKGRPVMKYEAVVYAGVRIG